MRAMAGGRWFALVAIGLLCGCEGQESGHEQDAASLDRIDAVADTFLMAIRQQEPEMFAQLFTPDATYAANDGSLWEGREEILAAAREWMQVPQDPSRTVVETEVLGDFAYVLDRYTSSVDLPNGPQMSVTGKSLAVFERQEDGSWRIAALVVNRDPETP